MNTITIYNTNLEKELQTTPGTTPLELLETLQGELGFMPINVRINNQTRSLLTPLYRPSRLHFVGMNEESGLRTYVRTLSFILSKAVSDIIPEGKVSVLHSLSNGYYCTIRNGQMIDSNEMKKIKGKMDELIRNNFTFSFETLLREDAIELFRKQNMPDKVALLETTDDIYYTCYSLDGYYDSYYGSLAPSTGYIYLYDLIPYMGGFLLRVPSIQNPSELAPLVPQPMMREVIDKQDRLLSFLETDYIGYLNRAVSENEVAELIQVSEAVQEKEIASIASSITARYDDGVRIVLVSGPSSSGKTTFTKRLRTQLIANYLRPHSISLDDYFVNREQTPRDEQGDYDYESLYALDLDLFNKDLYRLIEGEEVELPTFDFNTGRRIFTGRKLQLREGDLLLIEGIHALNPDLVPSLPSHSLFRVYVSALTAIGLDRHNRIPSTDNRLIRRIVRDGKYRGYSAFDTIRRWPSVRKGEEKWVFPYQENADAMFNSAMMYELAALRPFVEPLLRRVPRNTPEYSEAERLLRFIEQIQPIPTETLPPVSLLREFLGGSSFSY